MFHKSSSMLALVLMSITAACAADAIEQTDVPPIERAEAALTQKRMAATFQASENVSFDDLEVAASADGVVKCKCKCSTGTCKPAGCGTIDCGPAVVISE